MTWPDSVLRLAKAFSVAEGFGDPEALPTRANNPGDLTGSDGGSFQTHGTANSEGVLIFSSVHDGWQALYMKVNRMLAGKSKTYPLTLTLEQVGLKYSGGNPDWAENVAKYLGVPVTTTLRELSAPNSVTDPDLAV